MTLIDEQAVALDPKSPMVNSVLASLLLSVGRGEDAVAACGSIAAVEAEWCPLLQYDVAMSQKDYARVRAALEKPAADRGPQALAFFHAMMDALDSKGDRSVRSIGGA